jgi:hypothetical protein
VAVISPYFGSSRASGVDSDALPADGTVIWTSPSGDTYVTTPGSALLFLSFLPDVVVDDRCGERTVMMPTRRRTRAQNRVHRTPPNADKPARPRSTTTTVGGRVHLFGYGIVDIVVGRLLIC